MSAFQVGASPFAMFSIPADFSVGVKTPPLASQKYIPELVTVEIPDPHAKERQERKNVLIGLSASALGAIAAISIGHAASFKYVKGLTEDGAKFVEKSLRRSGELVKRKYYNKDTGKLSEIEKFIKGKLVQRDALRPDGFSKLWSDIFEDGIQTSRKAYRKDTGNTLFNMVYKDGKLFQIDGFKKDGLTLDWIITGISEDGTKFKRILLYADDGELVKKPAKERFEYVKNIVKENA